MSTKHSPKSSLGSYKAFADHIGELRTRAFWVVLAFIVASSVAYSFRDILVHIVLAPLGDQKLVYLTPAGGFAFIFQLTMYAGVVVTAPLLIYHLYKFVQPALPKRATRHSLRVIAASVGLMLAGVCFGYFVAVPAALHFLTEFAGNYIQANLTADSYLNFVVAYVVGLGVLFQLPLLLIFWNWISPLGPKKLLASEKFVVLLAFVAAAIMTPTPDPTNQAMVALPIILIYQIGAATVLLTNRKSKKTVELPEQRQVRDNFPALPVMEDPVEAPVVIPRTAPNPSQPNVVPVDGLRRQRAPMQRAERRLIAPQRPLPGRPSARRSMSMDGVSRSPNT